jgi:pyruvate dehydrogenase E2 component (dihydrolipoamide acetyltransferase)
MPQVGQDIETAIIREWLVKENSHVEKGDVIVEVESEKAVFNVEAECSGVILKILYENDEEVRVFDPIAYIGEPGETIEETPVPSLSNAHPSERQSPIAERQSEEQQQAVPSRIFASPSARRIARESGVDLTTVTGSGPGGRIIKRDVLMAKASTDGLTPPIPIAHGPLEETKPALSSVSRNGAPLDTVIEFSRMRRSIADRMTRSKQTIPHIFLTIEVDMTDALSWRMGYNQKNQMKISVNEMIIQSAASALAEFPGLNAHVAQDKLIQYNNINIGMALSTDEGLIVPVLPDAGNKSIEEIIRLTRETIENAKNGITKYPCIGTFTISNLSMYLVDSFFPIINPPECAILGVGRIEKRVVPIDGILIRDMMTLSLACDHRVVDGVYAAQFLEALKKRLEKADFE